MERRRERCPNPWIAVWVHPRRTIREVIAKNPRFRFVPLSFFYGLPLLLHFSQMLSLGLEATTASIFIASLILAPFAGMLGITIVSALVLWTGKWLKGKASFIEIRAAVSWANVTNVVTCLIWIFLTLHFGKTLFYSDFSATPFMGRELALVSSLFFLQFILGVWSIVILSHTIGEVQGFSAWKGLLNIVIPFVIFVIVATFILMMLPGVSSLSS